MKHKVCTSCKKSLPEDFFNKNASRSDGLHHACRKCKRLQSKKSHSNRRDYNLKKMQEWRQENPDYMKKYLTNYYIKNKPRYFAYAASRRAQKNKATPDWLTDTQLNEIQQFYWLAQDLKLVTGECYHVDHIVPLKGENVCGLHVPWNLQVLPADINLSKGNKYGNFT